IIVAATGAAAASVTGAAAGMLVARVDPASTLTAALASAALGGMFAAAAAAHSIAGRTLKRLCDDAACPACAQPNRSATFDQRGWAVCSACKGRLHAGQWLTAARVIGRIAPSSAWHAAATLAGLIGLAVAA